MADKYPNHAFGPRPVEQPKVEFEKDYKSIEILKRVKKTGEGENDYFIEDYVVEKFTPIQEVIDADKDGVGVENIIKQVLRTNDMSLLPVDKGNVDVDFVDAPTNLMELKQVGVDAEAAFKKLPTELVQDMDMKTFVNSMSQEKFDAFVKAVADRSSGKEKKDNE